MPVRILGTVGAHSQAGQRRGFLSLARNGSMVCQDAFAAAVERGRCFAGANQTGVTTSAGLSATTALGLVNPAGSGVVGRVWYAGCVFKVAFAAAGTVWLAAGTDTVATQVTAGVAANTNVRNLKLGGTGTLQGNKVACVFSASLQQTPVAICLLGVCFTDFTTAPTAPTLGRWFNGGIIVMPGATLSIQTSTASGAASCVADFIWEEQPILD